MGSVNLSVTLSSSLFLSRGFRALMRASDEMRYTKEGGVSDPETSGRLL